MTDTSYRSSLNRLPAMSGLTRRSVAKGFAAGGLAAAFGLPLTLAERALAQETPKRGGTVRLAVYQQSTGDTFDSARYDKSNDYIRGRAVYSYLTKLDTAGRAQPEVALSWEPNADATQWTFKMRTGITFSDGKDLTPEDVIFSIMRHKEEKVASSAKQLVANIVEVTADGPDGFVVRLSEPDVELPILLGLFQFALVQAGTYDFAKPVGTGAFVSVDFQPGIRTVLERNPNYWKDGRPYIDRLEMFPIPDASARSNALLSGDVDMVLELRGNGIEEVAKSDIADPFITQSTRYTAIQAAVDRAPSNNPDLMFAMTYMIDRQRVLDTVMRGYGTIANDHPFGELSPYYNGNLEQRSLDLDKAKYHLKKSGIGNTPVEVSMGEGVLYSVDIGQLMLREAQRAGLNLKIRREPAESYWTAVAGQRPFFATNFHPRPTYNMLLNLAWKPGAVWNFSHYDNERLASLIDQSRATLDEAKRVEQYHEIQSIIYNSGAISIPCFLSYVDGVSKKVKGLKPLPIGSLGGFDFADQIWLDA